VRGEEDCINIQMLLTEKVKESVNIFLFRVHTQGE
jgi:hypothetical protein